VQVLDASTQKLSQKTAVALGMFDGVHIGHKTVIQFAVDYAKTNNIKSAVITLANHPRKLTQGKAPDLITDLNARLEIFEELGVDYVLVLNFDEELMNTSAEEYLQKYLLDTLNAEFISTGYDHHFGKNRSGSIEMLKIWAERRNIQLVVVGEVDMGNEKISSSKIRQLIHAGNIKEANQLLGHKFKIISKVVKGKKQGTQIGFPTANLKLPEDTIIPANGVYSGNCSIEGISGNFRCAVNIGVRPSFDDGTYKSIETHILDFDQDIYGKTLHLELEDRIRDEKKFDSLDDLKKQIKEDILLSSRGGRSPTS